MTGFAISDNSRDSTQRYDEKAVTGFFQSRGFAVRKLDTKKDAGRNPDLELSKQGKVVAIVEVKSRFGNNAQSQITDSINNRLSELKFSYCYFIEHKYSRSPSNTDLNQITNLISNKIEKLETSVKSISFPHVIWLGDEAGLTQYLEEVDPYYNGREMPKETWIEMMTRNYWEGTLNSKLLVTLTSKNSLGRLQCQGTVPNMNFSRANYFQGCIDIANAQLKKYDQNIPKGIIFVGHGFVGGSYSDAVALYGDNFVLNPINPDCSLMTVNLNNSGILGRDRNTWLSLFGFFEAFHGVPPTLEVFRNCYAPTKLIVDHFRIRNILIYSFIDTGDDNNLLLMRNEP